jgi:NADPH-dependent curcumin reductase CurA
MGAWVASGEVKYREDVVEGIGNTVPAFIGLLEGRNFGKLLIEVSKP